MVTRKRKSLREENRKKARSGTNKGMKMSKTQTGSKLQERSNSSEWMPSTLVSMNDMIDVRE